jgi:hypothetical protein
LTYNYKKNYDEYEKCKENFVEDFSSANYFNQGASMSSSHKVLPKSSMLKDDQKDYINNLISKVEKIEYSKNKKQQTLKL